MKLNSLPVIAGLIVAGLAAMFGLAYLAAEAAGVQLTVHAWIAIGLGALVSLGLSALLFGLSFYSSRSGHDDEIGPD